MSIQTTKGWMDALANYLSTVPSLGLTKGTNLFAENFINEPDLISDQVVIFDEGFEVDESYQHLHLLWTVRFLTTKKDRIEVTEALSPIHDHLIGKRRFVAVSDSNDSFTVLKVRTVGSPDIADRTESGRFAASFTMQFQLIPD